MRYALQAARKKSRILRSGALDELDRSDAVRSAERFSVRRFQDGIRREKARALGL